MRPDDPQRIPFTCAVLDIFWLVLVFATAAVGHVCNTSSLEMDVQHTSKM